MKFRFNSSVLIKLAILALVFLIAPYALPFSLEFVLMADLMGLEALLLFLLYQSRGAVTALLVKARQWQDQLL